MAQPEIRFEIKVLSKYSIYYASTNFYELANCLNIYKECFIKVVFVRVIFWKLICICSLSGI